MQKSYERGRRLAAESVASSIEYTLSDYHGDVKRVLHSMATVGEGARFQNGDEIECSGIVEYSIIYLDTEGRLTPLSFTSDYELKMKCDGERCRDANTHTRVANYSVRLMGPRRFAVKALVECDAICSESSEYRVEGEGGDLPLEVRLESVKIGKVGFLKSGEIELAEEIAMLDGAIEDEVEVLAHRVEPRGVVCQRSEDGASVKCSLAVRSLIALKGEEPRNYESMLDLSCKLDGDYVVEGGDIVPQVSIQSSVISLNPSEAGVSVVASVIATASAEIYDNGEIELLDDCFSTDRGVDVEVGDFSYSEHAFAKQICEKITDTEVKIEDGRKIRNLIYETGRVRVGGISAEDMAVIIDGEIQVSGISCEIDDNGDICYSPVKFDVPMHINVNVGCHIPHNARCNCHLSSDSLKVDVNGSAFIVSCNVVGYISASAEKSCRAVLAINENEERYSRDPSLISVYYPVPEESLFDVAKRFHISVTRLAQINALSESVLASSDERGSLVGVSRLMIK